MRKTLESHIGREGRVRRWLELGRVIFVLRTGVQEHF
jgi:hypothetical protein